MEEPPGTDWTHYIAVYGALLATAVAAYNAFAEWRSRRPQVGVEVTEGAIGPATGVPSGHLIFFEAFNRGHKGVTLTMGGFVLPNGEQFVIPYPSPYLIFPHDLLPEKSCLGFTSAGDLAAHLKASGWPRRVSLIGFYKDAVGRRHRSKPTIFDTTTAKLAK